MSLWTHDRLVFHSDDRIIRKADGEIRQVLDHEAIENIPGHDPTLTEIMHMVDMPSGTTSTGWNAETARLFALDTAMTAIRRHLVSTPKPERQMGHVGAPAHG